MLIISINEGKANFCTPYYPAFLTKIKKLGGAKWDRQLLSFSRFGNDDENPLWEKRSVLYFKLKGREVCGMIDSS